MVDLFGLLSLRMYGRYVINSMILPRLSSQKQQALFPDDRIHIALVSGVG